MTNRTEIARFPYEDSVTSVAFSPDGRTLVSSAFNGKVAFWDVRGKAFKDQFLTRSLNLLRHASFTLDGGKVVTASQDGDIKIWEVDPEARTYSRVARFQADSGDQLLGARTAYSPDGTTFATSLGSGYERLGDYTIVLWDLSPYVTPVVHIADFTLKEAVRAILGRSDYGPITRDEMTRLTTLDVRNRGIRTLTGLEWATRLTRLNVEGNPLNASAANEQIPELQAAGVQVLYPRSLRTLAKLSGDQQQSLSGRPLEEPLVVEARDQNGVGFPGAAVTFAVTAGGGALSVETATTDALGRAATTLTLGEAKGTTRVSVTVAGLEPVVFTATGLLIPQTLAKVSGDGQEGVVGTALTEPLVVEVLDQNGNPLEGVRVAFSVPLGEGALSAKTVTTDAQGRVSITLTPLREGGIKVEVTVEGLKPVIFYARELPVARSLIMLSGDRQQGLAGSELSEPLVVQVFDQNGNALPGLQVTFAITAGDGTLSLETATTDIDGRAATTLTPLAGGTVSVEVTVEGLEPVVFTAVGQATPDFDGDGEVDFEDFFLFAQYFGGTNPHFDLDGDGEVGFGDFFLFTEHFGQPARSKLLALASERIGLPEGPQLQQNAPNPFNSGTVISWFQMQPGPTRLEVFSLSGQRVAVLHEGLEKAGLHRLHWEGNSDQGLALASGVYVYRLVTGDGVHARKLTLLR